MRFVEACVLLPGADALLAGAGVTDIQMAQLRQWCCERLAVAVVSPHAFSAATPYTRRESAAA